MNATTISSDALSFVCTLVRERVAIELDASKSYLVEARLAPIAKQAGFPSTDEFIAKVRAKQRPDLESRLIEAMTTNETSFFRDMHPFTALKTTIAPELIQNLAKQRTLNIWSAACSTGQELYSTAILLRDTFPELINWKVNLLGTDISDDVLQKAQSAKYTQLEVNRGLPAPMLAKYFQRNGMEWEIIPDIKSLATFKKMNLIGAWPMMPPMDIVFLRNVLIYFSPTNKKSILQRIRRVMAPQGILFLGAGETMMNLECDFVRVQVGNSVFYRLP